jgi:hypothetical protein
MPRHWLMTCAATIHNVSFSRAKSGSAGAIRAEVDPVSRRQAVSFGTEETGPVTDMDEEQAGRSRGALNRQNPDFARPVYSLGPGERAFLRNEDPP